MKKINLLFLLLAMPALIFAQVNLKQGLVAYYSFNSPANLGVDSTNYARDLTPSGIMTLSTDRKGKTQNALTFTEGMLNDYTMAGGLPVGTSARSFSVWFKKAIPTQLESPTQFLFFYGTMGTSEGIGMAVDYTGSLYFLGYLDDVITPFQLNFNQWYHVAGTYDGTTASLYLDGVLIDQQTKNWNTTGSNLRLGALLAGVQPGGSQVQYDNYFAGSMDEFRIYNRIITNDEILVLADKMVQGIGDSDIDTEVASLYPNPANDVLNLNLNGAFQKGITRVQLLDVTGKVIKTLQQQEWLHPIEVKDLPAGIYHCRIEGKAATRNLKFIKQ